MSSSHDSVTVAGSGELYESETTRLGTVQYQLSIIWPETAGEVPRIKARITGGNVNLADVIRRNPPVLTLRLEDQVRFDCRLTSERGDLVPVGSRFYRVTDGHRVEI